jgi:hypothetical protein
VYPTTGEDSVSRVNAHVTLSRELKERALGEHVRQKLARSTPSLTSSHYLVYNDVHLLQLSPLNSSICNTGIHTMAHDQPFRFLDLPKELRLMVYDCLPTITTHHKIRTSEYAYVQFNIQSLGHYIEAAPRTRFHDRDWPVHSVKIVRKTISGLSIFAICQQIASEAGAILHPKLLAISEGPAQFITNSIALESCQLAYMTGRFSVPSSGKNTKPLLNTDEEMPGDDGCYPTGTTPRPIHIAIRNSFLDSDAERCTTRMEVLRDQIYALVHTVWIHLYTGPPSHGYLHFRMACLTLEEKEAYDKVQPLACTCVSKDDEGTPMRTTNGGEVIESEEWEEEWAEGVRY